MAALGDLLGWGGRLVRQDQSHEGVFNIAVHAVDQPARHGFLRIQQNLEAADSLIPCRRPGPITVHICLFLNYGSRS